MHIWGDGFEYFYEVGEAANYIGKFCRKYGRIGVRDTKEKYGTARVYCRFSSNFLVIIYQIWIYRLAYKKAIKKFPYIKKEILYGADWQEYLEGMHD